MFIDAVISDDCLHLQGGLPPGPQRLHVVVFGGGGPKIVHFSQKTTAVSVREVLRNTTLG